MRRRDTGRAACAGVAYWSLEAVNIIGWTFGQLWQADSEPLKDHWDERVKRHRDEGFNVLECGRD